MNYAFALIVGLATLASPTVEAPEYTVAVNAEASYSAGNAGTVTFTVTAKDGYHVNLEYPVTFKPEGSEGLKFAEERIKLAAADKKPCADNAKESCVASFPVSLTPEKAGTAKLAGTFGFAICTPKSCFPKKVPVTATLTVK